MDTNALVSYLDVHIAEYEEWYQIRKETYLRIANSLFRSLPNYNITVLDSSKFNTFLRVIGTFLDKNEIFEEWKNVRSAIDFLLLNLAVKNEGEQKQFTLKLLGLLLHILKRTKPTHCKNFLAKKQILDTMFLLLNDEADVAVSNTDIAVPILKILDVVMNMEGVLTYNINSLIDIIMSLLLAENDIVNLCFLAKLILGRVSGIDEKFVHQMLQWIFKESVTYIEKGNSDSDISQEILSLILDLKSENNNSLILKKYPSFKDDFRNLWLKLMKISNTLWLLCKKNSSLSCLAQEVFNFTVLQFLAEEGMMNCSEEKVIEEMRLFHIDTDGEELPEKYFFFICHMQEIHSRHTWSPKIILRAMSYWFYNKRSRIDGPVLKSLLFLFPRLAISFSRSDYIAWSREMLNMALTYPSLSDIISFCQIQFVWILKMGNHTLKIETLRLWINETLLLKVLKKVITLCNAERLLLNLIVEDSGKKTGRMASKFLQKIGNKELSKDIARMLPFSSKEPNVFNCLILSNPGVPEKIEEKMILLEVLSVMIPSLAEDKVLRAACMYSNDLLEDMKREPKCFEAFSKYTSTIKFLLYASHRTEEDISKEILFLFKNLASIQVKYHIELKGTVETDPMMFLRGSSRQINRALKIFPIILSAKVDPLLKIKDETKLNLFYQMLNFVDKEDTQENALKCLHLLIRKYDWLSFSAGVGAFVKLWCCEQLAAGKSHIFMVFMILWLKKLIRVPKFLQPMIPFHEIQNFFMRNGDTSQMNHCSKILAMLQAEKCLELNKSAGSSRTTSQISVI